MVNRKSRHRKRMLIRTSSEALDILGGNTRVARWLGVQPNTVASWREPDRGVSRNFAIHLYSALVIDRGHELAPQVFGLDSWRSISIKGLRELPRKAPQRVLAFAGAHK